MSSQFIGTRIFMETLEQHKLRTFERVVSSLGTGADTLLQTNKKKKSKRRTPKDSFQVKKNIYYIIPVYRQLPTLPQWR